VRSLWCERRSRPRDSKARFGRSTSCRQALASGGLGEVLTPQRPWERPHWGSGVYDINAGEVAFGPVADDWPVARHLGIFDMPGDLIGYGALVRAGSAR